jgi:hypothetical protein
LHAPTLRRSLLSAVSATLLFVRLPRGLAHRHSCTHRRTLSVQSQLLVLSLEQPMYIAPIAVLRQYHQGHEVKTSLA